MDMSLQKRLRLPFELVLQLGERALALSRAEGREVAPLEVLIVATTTGLSAMQRCMACNTGVHCNAHAPPVPKERPPSRKAEPAHVRYARAYAEGQKDVTGEAFAPPTDSGARLAIVKMATAHGRWGDGTAIVGDDLLTWIRDTSAAYRRARGAEPEFESGFSPRSCLKWLDAGRPGGKAKRNGSTRQQAPETGRTWDREVG